MSGGSTHALGLDLSTQSASAVVLDSNTLQVVYRASINFDADLPHYKTQSGMLQGNGGQVTSPVAMWLEGLDKLFASLAETDAGGVGMATITSVSGSAQQHGSVYWGPDGEQKLGGVSADQPLGVALQGAFAVPNSPIWADSSTTAECRRLEAAFGGAEAVAECTGSRAYERFTLNQIARVATEDSKRWETCSRVQLVSSFLTSLLVGRYTPVDTSDGSGMNAMDLRSKRWDPKALNAHGVAGIDQRLGPDPVEPWSVAGTLSNYWVQRYHMSPTCAVVTCSGDNPCSLSGLGMTVGASGSGDLCLSLGTSDTLMGVTKTPSPKVDGHLMVSPVEPEGYFAMLVYKNGGVVREGVRDDVAGGSWETFEQLLQQEPPGNKGRLGVYLTLPEITPTLTTVGRHRVDSTGEPPAEVFPPAVEVRAAVEGRFLSMRGHAESLGLPRPSRVIAVGGASSNRPMMQVVADVFGAPVASSDALTDAAAVGAAYRAVHAVRCRHAATVIDFREVVGAAVDGQLKVVAEPNAEAHAAYEPLVGRYKELEARVAAM